MKRINLKSLEPRIAVLPAIKLAAKSVTMSFSQDKTQELWKSFGPLIKNILHKVGNDRYSVQVYPDIDFFKHFDPIRVFKKYAAIEVTEYDDLPIDLEKLIIPEGLYAIFNYRRVNDSYKLTLGSLLAYSIYYRLIEIVALG